MMSEARPSDRIIMEIIGCFLAGIGAGQFGLLATWAVLGPWGLYRQWFAALLMGLGLLLAFGFGISAVEKHASLPSLKEFLQMTLAISAVAVAAQAPLWLIRLFRGWRLVLRGADTARTAMESRQLQIRDILIAMTILALALGTMKLVVPNERVGAGELLGIILGGCGFAAVWSALMLPICVWACFGASPVGFRILVLTGYLVTLASIPVVVVMLTSPGMVSPLEPLAYLLLVHAGLLATLFAGLGLARACGYVLVSVRSARRGQAAVDDHWGAA
jgi:hypothetical protein